MQKNEVDTNDFPLLLITCKPPHIALLVLQMVYESALIIAINGLAISTIRFLENFNESKYIAFSTFAIGVVWMGFIPTYFATQNDPRLQSATVALAVMMMAFEMVICLILPRLYTTVQKKLNVNPTSADEHKSSVTMTMKTVPTTFSSGF